MDPACVSLPWFFLHFFLFFLFLTQTCICLFSREKVHGAGLARTLVQVFVLLSLNCRNLRLVPGAGDLGCVICTQEPAERFIFSSRCSDLFNLLLCPFQFPLYLPSKANLLPFYPPDTPIKVYVPFLTLESQLYLQCTCCQFKSPFFL